KSSGSVVGSWQLPRSQTYAVALPSIARLPSASGTSLASSATSDSLQPVITRAGTKVLASAAENASGSASAQTSTISLGVARANSSASSASVSATGRSVSAAERKTSPPSADLRKR